MKATSTIVIIAAVLSLQVSSLFAGNDITVTKSSNDATASYAVSIAPSTPAEATFDDESTLFDLTTLAPVTPPEASFEDPSSEIFPSVGLAPVAVERMTDNVE